MQPGEAAPATTAALMACLGDPRIAPPGCPRGAQSHRDPPRVAVALGTVGAPWDPRDAGQDQRSPPRGASHPTGTTAEPSASCPRIHPTEHPHTGAPPNLHHPGTAPGRANPLRGPGDRTRAALRGSHPRPYPAPALQPPAPEARAAPASSTAAARRDGEPGGRRRGGGRDPCGPRPAPRPAPAPLPARPGRLRAARRRPATIRLQSERPAAPCLSPGAGRLWAAGAASRSPLCTSCRRLLHPKKCCWAPAGPLKPPRGCLHPPTHVGP